jgi:hypothetical protein
VVARYAEGGVTGAELDVAFDLAFDAASELRQRAGETPDAFAQAAHAVSEACHPNELAEAVARRAHAAAKAAGMPDESSIHVAFVHDIFGNPFRRVTLDPSWLTSDVVALARAAYEERAFDRLPILADALEDAGCTDAAILSHCRGPGPHVRGCWVVDLILGKE